MIFTIAVLSFVILAMCMCYYIVNSVYEFQRRQRRELLRNHASFRIGVISGQMQLLQDVDFNDECAEKVNAVIQNEFAHLDAIIASLEIHVNESNKI